MKPKSGAGFTLLELTLVVAVLVFLTSLILVVMDNARAKARDAKRITDVQIVQTALGLFFSNHGYYPRLDGNGCEQVWAVYEFGPFDACWNDLQNKLSTYIDKLPIDPSLRTPDVGYQYETLKNGQGYIFMAFPETSSIGRGEQCYSTWYCKGDNWK